MQILNFQIKLIKLYLSCIANTYCCTSTSYSVTVSVLIKLFSCCHYLIKVCIPISTSFWQCGLRAISWSTTCTIFSCIHIGYITFWNAMIVVICSARTIFTTSWTACFTATRIFLTIFTWAITSTASCCWWNFSRTTTCITTLVSWTTTRAAINFSWTLI